MTSTAISAQGSVLQIATGTGGAKTVTAAAAGFPTIITATAHGLSNGNVVTLAGLSGATGINGTFVIKNKTTNTFAIDLDTTGSTITASSATATPVTYTAIGNFNALSGFDGEASEIDVTNLASTAKEYVLGLTDNGKVGIDFQWDLNDAGQQALLAAKNSGAIQNFRLILPNGKTATFTAFVKSFPVSLGVDQAIKSTAGLRISGPVTWS